MTPVPAAVVTVTVACLFGGWGMCLFEAIAPGVPRYRRVTLAIGALALFAIGTGTMGWILAGGVP